MSASRWARRLEQTWDGARLRRGTRMPVDLRIEPYIGHGSDHGVVVRGRVLDDPIPTEAVAGRGRRRRRAPYRATVPDRRPAGCSSAGHRRGHDCRDRHRRRRLLRGAPAARGLVGSQPRGPAGLSSSPTSTAASPIRRSRRSRSWSPVTTQVRGHLGRRRHHPGDRRPAGRADDPANVDRLRPHPDALPGRGKLYGDLEGRHQPGLLRLVQPLEPAQLPGGRSSRHASSRWGRCCFATCSEPPPVASRRRFVFRRSSTFTLDYGSCSSATPGEGSRDLRGRRSGEPGTNPCDIHSRGPARPGRRSGRGGLGHLDRGRALRARGRHRCRTAARGRGRPPVIGLRPHPVGLVVSAAESRACFIARIAADPGERSRPQRGQMRMVARPGTAYRHRWRSRSHGADLGTFPGGRWIT